jgi:hypothetical protein
MESQHTIHSINFVFLVIFCIEALLKLICMKQKYFHDSYNILDFVVICISLVTTIIEQFEV